MGESHSDFVADAVQGSARCEIKISEIGDLCMALMSGLQEHGALDEQQFKQRLHGVCPKCGIRLTGAGLMMVAMAKQFETPVFGGGSTMTERVFQGRCANEQCKSKRIVLEWDG
jgi:hypothetical protein